jgi:type VI protein secretion system component VasK
VSLLTEVLTISGVALDLVGAAVLSHAHNAESIAEIRAEIGAEKSALGEDDAIGTHAQLLAEKRIGFFILTFGLTVHLIGLVLKSPEGVFSMGILAAGVVAAGLLFTVLWTKIVGGRVRDQARQAEQKGDKDDLPEQ